VPRLHENLRVWDFPSSTVTVECAHEDKAYFGCLGQPIGVALNKDSLERLICPLCLEPLSHNNVQTYASSKADFEQRDDIYPDGRTAMIFN